MPADGLVRALGFAPGEGRENCAVLALVDLAARLGEAFFLERAHAAWSRTRRRMSERGQKETKMPRQNYVCLPPQSEHQFRRIGICASDVRFNGGVFEVAPISVARSAQRSRVTCG